MIFSASEICAPAIVQAAVKQRKKKSPYYPLRRKRSRKREAEKNSQFYPLEEKYNNNTSYMCLHLKIECLCFFFEIERKGAIQANIFYFNLKDSYGTNRVQLFKYAV